jgi:hypothetical protein
MFAPAETPNSAINFSSVDYILRFYRSRKKVVDGGCGRAYVCTAHLMRKKLYGLCSTGEFERYCGNRAYEATRMLNLKFVGFNTENVITRS